MSYFAEFNMPSASQLVTTMSTKGQVILPKAMRSRHRWSTGTRLIVEDHPEGVLLREERERAPTRIEDVLGMLSGPGPVLTVEQMDEAVSAEFARRARD